jgi:hypothetical protein
VSDRRLDEWLDAAGFAPIDDEPSGRERGDDPWADIDVPITPLSDEQRAYLSGSALLDPFDDGRIDAGPIDDAALADADTVVIEFPDDPGDVEQF